MQWLSPRKLTEPYLLRFVRGSRKGCKRLHAPPICLFRTEELSDKELDFFVQCYDYLVHGIQVPPPIQTKKFLASLKYRNCFGETVGKEIEKNNDDAEGTLLDLVCLPGSYPFVGWFFGSDESIELASERYHDILTLWRESKGTCLGTRFSFYTTANQFQYLFQIKLAMSKHFLQVTPKEMKILHSRHLNFIRSNDIGCNLITIFAKTLSGDSLHTISRKQTSSLPQSLRTLEILMRIVLKYSVEDLPFKSKICEDIKRRCSILSLNWWLPFQQLRGSSLSTSQYVPVFQSSHVHCPLYTLACSIFEEGSKLDETFVRRLTCEIGSLTAELERQEQCGLSQLDTLQAIDKKTVGDASGGVLDDSILNYPLPETISVTEKREIRSKIEDAQSEVIPRGWIFSMGLDSQGYLSYALRGCDILCSALGISFQQHDINHYFLHPWIQSMVKLRHLLRVHQLRRYALGATGIWVKRDEALQCFPFFESISLSLQVRSAVCILYFSVASYTFSDSFLCPSSLHLLSFLYPKLTPCKLFCGSVEKILSLTGPQILSGSVEFSSPYQNTTTLAFALTASQLEELQRQITLRKDDKRNYTEIGLIFRDGRPLSFFNIHQGIPFHHLS